jgi:hypothetical protein
VSLSARIFVGLLTGSFLVVTPILCEAQDRFSLTEDAASDPANVGAKRVLAGRWEFTIDGWIGAPTGRLQVGEFPTGSSKAGGAPGTQLRLSDLGIDVSGALGGTAAFHFTERDAVRVGYQYAFLRGSSTIAQSVVFNGQEFTAGSLQTNADYWQVSLAYERTLVSRPTGEQLVGSLGLTYTYFNPTLTGSSPPGTGVEPHGRSNSEDFYRQELPVPILGLRWDHPLGGNWLLHLAVSGGALPRMNSGRQEGGTVYLQQAQVDTSIGLAYTFNSHAQLEAGYHFTYFTQHEQSQEDDNFFQLFDNGAQVRFTLRF